LTGQARWLVDIGGELYHESYRGKPGVVRMATRLNLKSFKALNGSPEKAVM
jgi:hypothetical protein